VLIIGLVGVNPAQAGRRRIFIRRGPIAIHGDHIRGVGLLAELVKHELLAGILTEVDFVRLAESMGVAARRVSSAATTVVPQPQQAPDQLGIVCVHLSALDALNQGLDFRRVSRWDVIALVHQRYGPPILLVPG
jgi:hypothetical protein